MSRKNTTLVTWFFEALGIGLLIYAASRTLDFVQMTMPADKQIMGYLYLLSTGIGSIIWAQTYLKKAKGSTQRALSFGMGILDLIGEFVLVYADTIYVSSQTGQAVMTESELSTFLLASVALMAINAIAYYAFKLSDPVASAEQKAQDLVDEITDAAHKQMNTPEERQKMIDEHSPQIRAAVMAQVASNIADAVGRVVEAPPSSEIVVDPEKGFVPRYEQAVAMPDVALVKPQRPEWIQEAFDAEEKKAAGAGSEEKPVGDDASFPAGEETKKV